MSVKRCAKAHESASGKMVRCTEWTNHPSGMCINHRKVEVKK